MQDSPDHLAHGAWPPPPIIEPAPPPIKEPVEAFPKLNIWLMLLLVIVTKSLYGCYWLYRTNKIVKSIREDVGVEFWVIVASFVFTGFAAALSVYDIVIGKSVEIANMTPFAGAWASIFNLVLCFMVRRGLNLSLRLSGTEMEALGIWTFLFSYFYLQHRVNRMRRYVEIARADGH